MQDDRSCFEEGREPNAVVRERARADSSDAPVAVEVVVEDSSGEAWADPGVAAASTREASQAAWTWAGSCVGCNDLEQGRRKAQTRVGTGVGHRCGMAAAARSSAGSKEAYCNY